MQAQVKADNWVFEYLDSSIGKAISQLSAISFWRVLGMMFLYRGNVRLRIALDHLDRELKKPGNAPLAQIYLRYLAELWLFLIKRHWMLKIAVLSLFQTWRRLEEAKALLSAAPETSTLHLYYDRA